MAKKKQAVPASMLPPVVEPANFLSFCKCEQAIKSRLLREVGPEQNGNILDRNGNMTCLGEVAEKAWAVKSDPAGEYAGKWILVACCPFCTKRLNDH